MDWRDWQYARIADREQPQENAAHHCLYLGTPGIVHVAFVIARWEGPPGVVGVRLQCYPPEVGVVWMGSWFGFDT